MKSGHLFLESALKLRPSPPSPRLLVTLEPWHRAFLGNLREFAWPRRHAELKLTSSPAEFWDDVFIRSRLPWTSFAESAIYHAAAILVVWSLATYWPVRPQVVEAPAFHSSDVIYYDASEYLQPLDTGGPHTPAEQKGDPEYAKQPILSVPANADNRSQTIVTPPKVKLTSDVPMPNVVAWNRAQPTIPLAAVTPSSRPDVPLLPNAVIAPAPEVRDSKLNRASQLDDSVVAPAPAVSEAALRRKLELPTPAVLEPPPSLDSTSSRRMSDINIGHSDVVAPTPQLPMDAQIARSSAARPSLGSGETTAVAPPPSMQGTGVARSDGRLVALSLHPAPPSASVEAPNGNRRGTFAATPEGKIGATGTPDPPSTNKAAGSGTVGHGSGDGAGSSQTAKGLPSGLFVGAPKSGGVAAIAGAGGGRPGSEPRTVASAAPAGAGSVPRNVAREMDPSQQTEQERAVFSGRKSYSMTLNMPNLNSAGGSWVMHFVEMKQDEKASGELFAPVPTRTVDPGYPLELMRQNVHGTVTLSAVIHSDGHVGDVIVVNGVDDRIDQYATSALQRWLFLPALRNGEAVPLKAVVMIPFRPRKAF